MRHLIAALMFAASTPALASECEQNFSKSGNPLTGTTYKTSVSAPGLTAAEGMAQLRGLAVKEKYHILAEDTGGNILMEAPETMTHKAIPMTFSTVDGKVSMEVSLNRGALTTANAMRKYMCEQLAQIQPGDGGSTLASLGESAGSQVLEYDAWRLANMLDRERKERGEAVINARYRGKHIRLKGRANPPREGFTGPHISYDTYDRTKGLSQTGFICRMAADQAVFSLKVRKGDRLDLTGEFVAYDDTFGAFVLEDCRNNS